MTLAEVDACLAGHFATLTVFPFVLVGIGVGIGVAQYPPFRGSYEDALAALCAFACGGVGYAAGWRLYYLIAPVACGVLWVFAALFGLQLPKRTWFRRRSLTAGQAIITLLRLRIELQRAQRRQAEEQTAGT